MSVPSADAAAPPKDAIGDSDAPEARVVRVGALYRRCPTADLGFETTADVAEIDEIVGQERAVEAIDLAITSTGPGFNVYALGPPGIGKSTAIRQFLTRRAAGVPAPDDWCYVHNFADHQRPRALRVPAGTGVVLRDAMAQLCLELQGAIPAAFESDDYRRRKEAIEAEFEARREAQLTELEKRAKGLGIALVRTPIGIGFAPTRNGEVIATEDFRRMPEADQARVRRDIAGLETDLQAALHQLPQWQREARRLVRELNRDVIRAAVEHLIEELRRRFESLPAVIEYLDGVERDVVHRAPEFLAAAAQADSNPDAAGTLDSDGGRFRRYTVNVLVRHDAEAGAPIVIDDHPTYANLVGRIEYVAQLGTLVTDFTLVRAGALHRANGGYLVLEADKVLLEPYAWEQLKRAIRTREIRVEPLGQSLGLLTTATLEPEPIPLDVKVALIGDRRLYYLLCAFDPEFPELFKVAADFEDDVDWTPDTTRLYARLIATLARREGLRPFAAAAVGRIVEYLARIAEDASKLSTHMGRLADLMREADHRARRLGRATVARTDVEHAIEARTRRSSRIYERLQAEIQRSTIRVDLEGSAIGQVNALSVIQLGEERFGHPSRVTATARLGRGEVVDIEREVELGGPIHSKGVLILSGFLGGRFGLAPLTLHASLVFEQSYGGVEGDSASLAELCALLSAIGGVPIRQDLAITGSVDQRGFAQAIGGVNEKIEGFFDACQKRGLTGTQGVIIPAANVRHLMLAAHVRRAVRARRFRIFSVSTVDEAMELLSGLPAGTPGTTGAFPVDTVNGRVQAGLATFAEVASRFDIAGSDNGREGKGRRSGRRSRNGTGGSGG
ncbi:MAG TPA: AAA family ATPase [Candidatus Limnocylindrales bacterium]|nr:AAA family ATPase [Candidatus Limnocylindrales bacterium]